MGGSAEDCASMRGSAPSDASRASGRRGQAREPAPVGETSGGTSAGRDGGTGPARARLLLVDERLRRCYGDRPWEPRFADLLDGLIHTILSQNTSDANSHLAFRRLKERFPDWEEAASARVEEIEEAIRPGGISRVKAERIKVLLERVEREFGSYCLSALGEMSPGEALAYLLGLPGVGRKTAAVLLLFQLGYPFFPVDTHVFRVGKRLGLITPRMDVVKAHEVMDRAVPDGIKYRLHLNMVEHGRKVCRARRPDCHACCLRDICPYPGQGGEGGPIRLADSGKNYYEAYSANMGCEGRGR